MPVLETETGRWQTSGSLVAYGVVFKIMDISLQRWNGVHVRPPASDAGGDDQHVASGGGEQSSAQSRRTTCSGSSEQAVARLAPLDHEQRAHQHLHCVRSPPTIMNYLYLNQELHRCFVVRCSETHKTAPGVERSAATSKFSTDSLMRQSNVPVLFLCCFEFNPSSRNAALFSCRASFRRSVRRLLAKFSSAPRRPHLPTPPHPQVLHKNRQPSEAPRHRRCPRSREFRAVMGIAVIVLYLSLVAGRK